MHWPNLVYILVLLLGVFWCVLHDHLAWGGLLLFGCWVVAVTCDIQKVDE